LQHEILNQQSPDFLFQCRRIIHRKTTALCLAEGTCSKIGHGSSLNLTQTALLEPNRLIAVEVVPASLGLGHAALR
jgi:hypothetical protein